MKTLSQLTARLAPVRTVGGLDIPVSAVVSDSRRVTPGSVFVAVRGVSSDGHDFIASAVASGAAAVVCERLPEPLAEGPAYLVVPSSAEALGVMAQAFYDYPSEHLTLVGVTGTNGKTTIATLLYRLYRALGHKVGLLSTVVNYVDDRAVEATHTTPDPLALAALLGEMVDAGCTHAFMEVSSHAVDQRRIAGLRFAGGIFTNLTRDHLDYHKTVENYLRAKKRFFDDLPREAFALTNLDDRNGLVMTQNTAARVITYSCRTLADIHTRILEDTFDGLLLDINGTEAHLPFIGRFNAANLSAVIGAATALGADFGETLRILSGLRPPSGRFDYLKSPRGYTAIVDYAHTPDALTNVISTINEILAPDARLFTVVGCGGNRDKGKRPIMAAEAVHGSFRAVLTSDNPRDEEPLAILADMTAGLSAAEREQTLVIPDRAEAIREACALAARGDVVLVAGKGHEDYQIIRGVKHHFDDHEVLRSIFAEEQQV